MVDINLTQQAGALPKFLFRKKDDTSIGFALKKLFLGPLMRNEAKRQILNILSQPAFKNRVEAQTLVKHIQALSWGKGVDADKVSAVIARTILASSRESNDKAALNLNLFINDALESEIINNYLDSPDNLKVEIRECYGHPIKNSPVLEKLITLIDDPNCKVDLEDMQEMNTFIKGIEDSKNNSTTKLSFELPRKIREVFTLAAPRFDETSDKKAVRESQPEKSVGNKSDVPMIVTNESTTTAIAKEADTDQSMTARRKALSNYMQEGIKALNDENHLLLEKCSENPEIFRPFSLSINPEIDADKLYDKLKIDLRLFFENTSDDIPL